MHHLIAAVLAGSIVGGASSNRLRLRPMLRSAIKGGILAKRKVQALSASVVAETQQLVSEARAELNETKSEQTS